MDDPGFQAVAVPLVIAFTAMAAAWGLPTAGRSLALGACLGIAPLVAWGLLEGVPGFPPVQAKHKAFFAAASGGGMGLLLEAFRAGHKLRWVAMVLWVAGVLAWLGWRHWVAGPDWSFVAAGFAWGVAALLLLCRFDHLAEEQGAVGVLAGLLPTAAGLTGVALRGASASVALVAAAIAAGTGGAALVVYGQQIRGGRRFEAGPAAAWAGGGALLALGAVTVWFVPLASRIALALLVLAPWASALLPQPAEATRVARMTYPLLLLGAGGVIAVAAWGVAAVDRS